MKTADVKSGMYLLDPLVRWACPSMRYMDVTKMMKYIPCSSVPITSFAMFTKVMLG